MMIALFADILLPLAARSSDGKSGGGWFFLVIVAIWVIFSIISAIAKKQEEEKRKRVRQQIERGMPPSQPMPSQPMQPVPDIFQPRMQRSPVAKPQSAQRAQPVARQQLVVRQQQQLLLRQQQQRQQPARAAQQRVPVDPGARGIKRSAPPRTAPPPIPARAAQVVQSVVGSLPATRPEIAATEIRASDAKKPRGMVNADSLHRWLRPETLRQQFMLTEVLQPPLALRPPRE